MFSYYHWSLCSSEHVYTVTTCRAHVLHVTTPQSDAEHDGVTLSKSLLAHVLCMHMAIAWLLIRDFCIED